MKTTLKYFKLCLLSALLLAWAGSAKAAGVTKYIGSDTLWSTITPVPTEIDTVIVTNGATLTIDVGNAVCTNLVIGDINSSGIVGFASDSAKKLTVYNDLEFGTNTSSLNMASAIAQLHTVVVKGTAFVNGINGTFLAGVGTVEYSGGAQVVADLVYKNLTLGGTGVKNVNGFAASGIDVAGNLIVSGTATLSGVPINYGPNATLEYKSVDGPQTTSDLEFPTTMLKAVKISTALGTGGVSLNNNKSLYATLTISSGAALKDTIYGASTNTLAAYFDIVNNGAHFGAGKIILAGSSAQTLSGSGTYGNVQLTNPLGAVFSVNTTISGKLTITSGAVTLPNGTASTALALNYSVTDQAAGTYGATASGATTKSDTAFAATFTGVLTVGNKLSPTFTTLPASPIAVMYATNNFVVTGKVTGGNGSLNGETVIVTIADLGSVTTNTFNNDGSFSATFHLDTLPNPLPVAGNRQITIAYQGGIYLAAKTDTSLQLLVTKRQLFITPDTYSKTYGDPDPAFYPAGILTSNAFTAAFLGTTTNLLTGAPSRSDVNNQNSGIYSINQGTLTVNGQATPDNYVIIFDNSKKLTINPRPVTISASSQTKTYGDDIAGVVNYAGLLPDSNTLVPVQTSTVTKPTVVWTTVTPVKTTPPGVYAFTIFNNASDPNYSVSSGSLSGTYTIGKKAVVVTANNQTKVANGSVFPASSLTVSYNGFVNGETSTTAGITGSPVFGALTATTQGVYPITLDVTGMSSPKYTFSSVNGNLVITTDVPINTSTSTSSATWAGGDSYNWQINDAIGTAGADPGWSLRSITGDTSSLTITATPGSPFIINVTTLGSAHAAGPMAHFDPTRTYSWKIIQVAGVDISGYTGTSQFQIVTSGNGFFANNTFGGSFSVVKPNNRELDLVFTPAAPSAVRVGTLSDVTTLLGSVVHSDSDVLYLQPSTTNMTAQDTVTLSLNVANLHEPIIAAQALIKWDSRFFNAKIGTPGAPNVVPGGGVWNDLVTQLYTTNGQFDVVMGLSFTASQAGGSQADATVAYITLTPTRITTGDTRVIFRSDSDTIPVVGIDGGTLLQSVSGTTIKSVYPARVYTDLITIQGDTNAPQIISLTATQNQPGIGVTNVLNGPSGDSDTVKSGRVVRGDVNITVVANDSTNNVIGVGLAGPPVLILSHRNPDLSVALITVPATDTNAVVGPFQYVWSVGTNANGLWYGQVVASDTLLDANNNPAPGHQTTNTFTLTVNKNQVTGVVELEAYKGTNNTVTFSAGNGSSITKTASLTLNFISGKFLKAGSFRNLKAFADALIDPTQQVSRYLTYGSIANLPTLVNKLVNSTDGVSAYSYVHDLFFGYFAPTSTLSSVATSLYAPTRTIDQYVQGRLSNSTIVLLNSFKTTASTNANYASISNALTAALLLDFNAIALGPNIYDALRFQGVALSVGTTTAIAAVAAMDPQPVAGDINLVNLNKDLLEDAFAGYNAGAFTAQTVAALVNYTGGANVSLENLILQDFYSLSGSSVVGTNFYTAQRFLGIQLRGDTAALVLSHGDAIKVATMNRMLLEDLYAGMYTSGKLTAATAAALAVYEAGSVNNTANAAALESALVSDLNALITTTSIYQADRFAAFSNGFGVELTGLLQVASPTAAQLTRLNRLLLEAAYSGVISQSVLAEYSLTDVADGTTAISAKTATSLLSKVSIPTTGDANPDGVANFVNNGLAHTTAGQFDATDHYLRAGDLTGDGKCNITDYSILKANWLKVGTTTAALPGDLNGDNKVNISDYTLIKNNFNKAGDTDVNH